MSVTLRELQARIRGFYATRHHDNIRDTDSSERTLPPFISMDDSNNYYDNSENATRLAELDQNILNQYVNSMIDSAQRHTNRLQQENNGGKKSKTKRTKAVKKRKNRKTRSKR